MKKYGAILGGVVLLSIVALSMASLTANQASDDSDKGSVLSAPLQIQVTEVPASGHGKSMISAASGHIVWFAPQDLSTNATVLILDNTTSSQVTVGLTIYDVTGSTVGQWLINIGGGLQARLCSDPIVSVEGPWGGGQYVNFTSAAATGILNVPDGVAIDGYIAWNGASNVFDPGAAVPVLPLRFIIN